MHTVLSHDGKMTLDELVTFLKDKGYDYIAVTEHSYDIDNQSMSKLAERAAELSSDDFLVIPGIEFRCHGWVDIIGYGVVETIDSEDPVEVIDHIHRHGGVAVFAHPNVRDYPIDDGWVAMLDGCELWNISNEGKHLPQPGGLKKFRQLARANSGLLAFSGLDLHRTESYWNLFTETSVDGRDRLSILKALGAGDFRSVSPWFSVGSDGRVPALKRVFVAASRRVLNGIRKMRDVIR